MIELNKTCQQEIFSGHRVTSPMLFGIKTEGQLGGNTELRSSYELFKSTYSQPKANSFDKELNYILSYSSKPADYKLRPTDPIGLQFDVKDFIDSIPLAFVFEKLGIPKEMWPAEEIASATPIAAPTLDSDIPVNENMKNLTGRQLNHVERVVRKYKEGKMTVEMAKAMLRTGLGLTDSDINEILGIKAAAMSAQQQEDSIIAMFDECGDNKEDFEILKSKMVCFTNDLEAEEDEAIYIQEAFKTVDVTKTEDAILQLIKKDPKITPKVIADTIGQTESYVNSKLSSLIKRGYLESKVEKVGVDDVVSRAVPSNIEAVPPDVTKNLPVQVSVKYSYEVKPNIGPPLIPTSRPFCIRMIGLNRLYSRAEIEKISLRLGYSVWDRKGGWWGHKEECRHRWVSNIVVKKK
jgi:DNA-binding CsgD family transcriptional regulator